MTEFVHHSMGRYSVCLLCISKNLNLSVWDVTKYRGAFIASLITVMFFFFHGSQVQLLVVLAMKMCH